MKRLQPSSALALALAFSLATTTLAVDPSPTPLSPAIPANAVLEPNAALRYWFALDFLPRTEPDITLLGEWEYYPLDGSVKNLLQRGQRSIEYLRKGAQCAECNWGLDYSEGPQLLLPHVGKLRDLGRFVCLDARLKFEEKQPKAAVDQLCDALILARHVAYDNILISLLVRYSIENSAIRTLGAHLKELDAETLTHLQKRLGSLPRSTSMADCLEGEQKWFVEWTIRRIRSGGKTDWFSIYGDETEASRALQKDAQACLPQLEALGPWLAEGRKLLAANLSADERARQTDALRERVKDNPFATAIFNDYVKVYDTESAALTRLDLLQAAITVCQKGPDVVKTLTDPILKKPLQYVATPKGFRLTSDVTHEGERVTLTVGPEN